MSSALHQLVCAVRDDLNRCLLERQVAVDNALVALLAGEHFLQLGPAGTGKSLLARAIHHRIVDTTYFETLLTPFSVPEELFGPVDLVGYADKGVYRRISHGAITEAFIAFVDEIYKANSAILNCLLTITNERLVHEVGMPPQRVPLRTMFAASNETPSESSLDALDDRFVLRQVVQYITDDQNFISLVTGHMSKIDDVQASISLADLEAAQAECMTIKGSTEALQGLQTLRHLLAQEGIIVSDRTWNHLGPVLKARAWLDGQDTVDIETLTCMAHVCWKNPKDMKAVERIVYNVACPLALRAIDIEDKAAEMFSKAPADTDPNVAAALENILQQLTDQEFMLQTTMTRSKARNRARAEQALATIQSMHTKISARIFARTNRHRLDI